MGPADVSNTSTLYDQGLKYFHVTVTGIQTITSRPTRLMSVILSNQATGSSVTLHDGLDTDGEIVGNLAVSTAFHLVTKMRTFDVALSGGLTVDVIDGPPDVTINYI